MRIHIPLVLVMFCANVLCAAPKAQLIPWASSVDPPKEMKPSLSQKGNASAKLECRTET